MASIKLKGDTSGEVTISAPAVAGTTTLELPATSSTLATQNSLGVRNLIINGDMRIAQRGTTATPSTGTAYYTVDRFNFRDQNTGAYTIDQSTDAPTNFTHSTKITVTAADTSIASGERYWISTILEGQNISHLNFGSSDAQTVTLSFYVKSSLTGTFSGALQNNDYNRGYAFEYTISSANTWERKTITIAGDTTGTWLTTNGVGLRIFWDLGAASNRQITSGSWQVSSASAATGASQVIANNGATFYITGIQLEAGNTATPFEHRPYDMELARCQRYCQVYLNPPLRGVVEVNPTTRANRMAMVLPVVMRTAPDTSITQTGSSSHVRIYDGTGTQLYSSVAATYITPSSVEYDFIMGGALIGGRPAILYYGTTTQSQFLLTAEL